MGVVFLLGGFGARYDVAALRASRFALPPRAYARTRPRLLQPLHTFMLWVWSEEGYRWMWTSLRRVRCRLCRIPLLQWYKRSVQHDCDLRLSRHFTRSLV